MCPRAGEGHSSMRRAADVVSTVSCCSSLAHKSPAVHLALSQGAVRQNKDSASFSQESALQVVRLPRLCNDFRRLKELLFYEMTSLVDTLTPRSIQLGQLIHHQLTSNH